MSVYVAGCKKEEVTRSRARDEGKKDARGGGGKIRKSDTHSWFEKKRSMYEKFSWAKTIL